MDAPHLMVFEEVERDQLEIEIATNETVLLDPLNDHDYVQTNPPQQPKPKTKKQTKRPVKITKITAIYNCKICGYTTMKKEVMDKHRDTHERIKPGTQYIACTSCNINKNQGPKGYEKCTQCSYFTKNKSSLKLHMRIHLNGKPYKCTECDFYAKDLKELIRHHEEGHVTVKNFVCEICAYATHIKERFLAHKRTHSGERPFVCGICFYAASERGNLTRHMKKHRM